MSTSVYLPSDEFSGSGPPDLDLAADYLELKAAFSVNAQSFSEDIIDALEQTADREYDDVDAEIREREEIAGGAVARMGFRKRVLNTAYPFDIDSQGDTVSFTADQPSPGQAAYLVSLLLSNLRALSPLLNGSPLHPSEPQVQELRQFFQYFATAAIAAEVGGPACSFGFPRPDGSGFLKKLSDIWAILKDGTVKADPSAPTAPKDDQVDVFAWREQKDGLPGFLLAAAQVATGKNWKDKSIKSHLVNVFPTRWFDRAPVTQMVAYHVVPFARPDEQFRDDVLVLGNVLHRLRVPRRVTEATRLAQNGLRIEALERLDDATAWVRGYVQRARTS